LNLLQSIVGFFKSILMNTKHVCIAGSNDIIMKNSALNNFRILFNKVGESQLSIDEAVRSYLFNSQIVTCPDGQMTMIAPIESIEGRPRAVIDEMISADNPINGVHFVDLRQSMANGGGPACLRLRVLLTPGELAQTHPGYILDDQKFDLIEKWINTHYRETLTIDELKSPQLLDKSRQALDKLTSLLDLGKIYSFQK